MRSSTGLAPRSQHFGRGASLLEQKNPYSQNSLSPTQGQVDSLVGGFVQQATDWRALAAVTSGGVAYRMGRAGLSGWRMGGPASSLLRMASVSGGLAAEVSAFELAHRGLSSEKPNLWRWSGRGGLQEGLLQSFIAFGTFKGLGHAARGENFLVQHLLQDSAVVLGHQASARLGLLPAPSGTLAEQFLHAKVTNLQIGAGLVFVRGFAPGLLRAEAGLERARAAEGRENHFGFEWALSAPATGSGRAPFSLSSERNLRPPTLMAMSGLGEGEGGTAPALPGTPRVSRTLPPVAPETKAPPFSYELHLEGFSRFENMGHEGVIATREGRDFRVRVGHRAKTKAWDRYFAAGTTKVTLQLREGKTLGRAVLYLEPESINLYSISNQATKNARKMLPGAGTIFLDWLATQAALEGKNLNIIRVENTQILRILSRSQLVDPQSSMIEGCLWSKDGYRVDGAGQWGRWEFVEDYEGGRYHFLNVRARPNPSLLPPPPSTAGN